MSETSPLLQVADLEKRFGRRRLFRYLSFDLAPGSTLAVLGANGAGKSSLLKILAGVLRPTNGTVALRLNGKKIEKDTHPLHVGMVAPYLNVYDGFTPRENLMFIARARRLDHPDDRIEDVLGRVELTERADDLVATFSSGMKQRVKIASAILPNPPLLLLDEPNVNLDAAGRSMVRTIINRQTTNGGLVVVATNDDQEAGRHDATLQIEDHL